MFDRKVKVIEHGFFYKNSMLETKCACGCVYRTPKRKVHIYERTNGDVIFETNCPECVKANRQFRSEMAKEACKDERETV